MQLEKRFFYLEIACVSLIMTVIHELNFFGIKRIQD